MDKVGFIGGGKMADAIIANLVNSGVLAAQDIIVSDVSEERRNSLKRRKGITVLADNRALLGLCRIAFLAVKPQDLDAVLKESAGAVTRDHLLISIAAGKRLAHLESLLPDARVIRVMPNLPIMVSEGMSVFALGTRATLEDRRVAQVLFAACGRALELPEEHFDAVTALSGSGPAFFAHLLQLMSEAGEQLGIPKKDALSLAEQTMLGSAKLLALGPMTPEALIAAVSSAKGTTAAGMSVLQASPIGQIIRDTLAAAARRSEELSRL